MTEQSPKNEDEKFDEKEMEKREEKAPEEKSWDEKYRRDPLGAIIWALILIWAGLVFLAANMGMLDRLMRESLNVPGINFVGKLVGAWPVVLIGAGVLLLVEVVIRLMVPAYRRPVTGTLILAVILIGVGLGDLISWNFIWPLILIILGVSFLFRATRRSG
jgi:hypothetical protein